MAPTPSAGTIFITALCTIPGFLIATGLLWGVLVLVIPLTWSEADGWRASEKVIVWTDWGISIAAFLIGLGLLTMKLELATSYGPVGNSRFGLTGLFFYIAFRRAYSRIKA